MIESKEFQELRNQRNEADKEYSEWLNRKAELKDQAETARIEMISTMAKHRVQDASKKDVEHAEKRYQDAKNAVDDAEIQTAVASETLKLLQGKTDQARIKFVKAIESEALKEIPALQKKLDTALATLESVISDIEKSKSKYFHLIHDNKAGDPVRISRLYPEKFEVFIGDISLSKFRKTLTK